ncbi:hypothetical protein EVB94_061 [Rhizobium phage RHph_TM40]|uniref:Uncharacterized protein n=1 Tax=Rhizobium phage RHph_Y65 TaxID=2509785 RepID=A0A7S5R7N5_9CAUD|nr:hypothetical protein PQC17_gp059 [Rhizobium phage RHph_Y65]QIG71532.1 hypothetical protein EVB94_061 [Rhizobium phage RHph_TM40]QIG71895.1 hypothetical protein EVB95_061 [Rhizobium phage RHph_TM2_3B]QIG72257.1 hypothetical protein EVB96_061 [Rhizobium phage RHph_TM3_3_6]QIG72617.1 hypothetical protein EVB97_059 [Rhizobium phage RHph_Y65]
MALGHTIFEYSAFVLERNKMKLSNVDLATTLQQIYYTDLTVYGYTGVLLKDENEKDVIIHDIILQDEQSFFNHTGYVRLPELLSKYHSLLNKTIGHDFVKLHYRDGRWYDPAELTSMPGYVDGALLEHLRKCDY